MSEIANVASWLRAARAVTVVTGAGISAESGVPTFRGADGLWRSFRAEDLATPEAFERNPELVWEWYRWRQTKIATAQPNAGHHALVRFESRMPAFLLLTQNVDGLHTRAGSRRLVELHGNIWRARCVREGTVFDESRQSGVGSRQLDTQAAAAAPISAGCPSCGALLRPDVVWFGESLDPVVIGRALAAVETCEALLLVGTSGVVYPVAGFPAIARGHGARIIEINVEPTPLSQISHAVLRGTAATILPALEAAL